MSAVSTEAHYNPALFETDRWDTPTDRWLARRIEATVAALPTGTRTVLDVGCGDGRLTHVVAQAGFSVMGIDLSPTALARVKAPRVRGSCGALPFADGAFDAVICSEVIEHLPDPLQRNTLAELRRVARDAVIITVPHREELRRAFVKCPDCDHVFHGHGHLHSFTPDKVNDLLPGADRVEVIAKPRGAYDPRLLDLLQGIMGRYAYMTNVICPECSNANFETRRVDPVRKVIGGINRVVTRGRTEQGGWILGRFRA